MIQADMSAGLLEFRATENTWMLSDLTSKTTKCMQLRRLKLKAYFQSSVFVLDAPWNLFANTDRPMSKVLLTGPDIIGPSDGLDK